MCHYFSAIMQEGQGALASSTEKIPKDSWLVNLRIAGSVSSNTVEKAVSWNVGPHGYQRGKKEIHKLFEQGPP